jgi:hypothetical protein
MFPDKKTNKVCIVCNGAMIPVLHAALCWRKGRCASFAKVKSPGGVQTGESIMAGNDKHMPDLEKKISALSDALAYLGQDLVAGAKLVVGKQ